MWFKMLTAELLGLIYGKHAKQCIKMKNYMDKATKKWLKTRPKSGSTLPLKKFLTDKEYYDYKMCKKGFEAYWAKERKKAGLKGVIS